jgi:hypothetical protein
MRLAGSPGCARVEVCAQRPARRRRSAALSVELCLDEERREFGAGANTELPIRAVQVRLDRLDGKEQPGRRGSTATVLSPPYWRPWSRPVAPRSRGQATTPLPRRCRTHRGPADHLRRPARSERCPRQQDRRREAAGVPRPTVRKGPAGDDSRRRPTTARARRREVAHSRQLAPVSHRERFGSHRRIRNPKRRPDATELSTCRGNRGAMAAS